MIMEILVILFIGLWLIEVKKNKDLKEQDELYMLLLEYLLSQAYDVIPDKEEELISQIEEVLYEDTEEDI